ncbi:MAG TPA: FecR domain-containing protein [Albitalea sp.]|uniref:FecR family protein n=1 Tax=Piscinibacter sp. TaxID=1903157 RepID=UPI002ED4BA6F
MSTHEEIEARAASWVARRDATDWTDAEQRDLDAWIEESTAHRVAYLRMSRTWELADALSTRTGALRPVATASAPRPVLPRFRQWKWAAAAAVVLSVAIGAATVPGLLFTKDYVTAVGRQQEVTLSDGSHVQMNTDTRLRTSVLAWRRTVWLDRGEAYFEVAHDAEHPFVVDTGASRITVLGTKFAVRREDGQVVVTVVDGSVRVDAVGGRPAAEASVPDSSAVLMAYDSAVVAANHVVRRAQTAAQVGDELSWRIGQVVFDHMTLEDAARVFNRSNVRQLVIADAETARIRIGGRFEVTNVDGFARLLQVGFGVQVRREGDRIILSGGRTGS